MNSRSVVARLCRSGISRGSRRGYSSSAGSAAKKDRGFNFTPLVLFSTGVASGIFAYQKVSAGLPASGITDSTLPLNKLSGDPIYAPASVQAIAFAEIAKIVGDTNVAKSHDDIEQHADSSWQTRHHKQGEVPGLVVYPSTTEEISQIMKVCHKYRVPVTAFSGGTSLEGHFTPVYGGISLDLSKMNKIIQINKQDLDVVVQPAVGWEDLADSLAAEGLMFGPDPGPGAQIGGMIGTSCSGTNAYRYGTMRENVVNLTVVLADGTIIKTRQRPRKSSAGYNLTGVFIGAEGTLGIVTEATLKLHSLPQLRRVGMLTFNSIKEATDTVQGVLQSGIQLDAMELLDDKQMEFINKSGETDRKWTEKPTLLLRFAGSNDAIKEQIKQVKEISKNNGSLELIFANSKDETDQLWAARKNALWSVFYGAPQGYKVWTTDVAVPISHLSDIITETQKDIVDSGIIGTILGHVGDGNFHAILAYDPATQLKNVEDVAHRMVMNALKLEGTCTGEHGVGAGKRHYVIEELGEDAVSAMRKLKQAYDPLFILNPGKVFSIAPTKDVEDH